MSLVIIYRCFINCFNLCSKRVCYSGMPWGGLFVLQAVLVGLDGFFETQI